MQLHPQNLGMIYWIAMVMGGFLTGFAWHMRDLQELIQEEE